MTVWSATKKLLPFISLVATLGPAWAGRPLATEDAGVIEAGACEIEAVWATERISGARSHLGTAQLGCGVAGHTQLALLAGRERADGSSAQLLMAIGKHQLLSWGPEDAQSQFAIAWSLQGRREPGASLRRSGADIKAVGSLPVAGNATFHANLGHARDLAARESSTTWSLAVEHNGLGEGGRWQPMAELYGHDRPGGEPTFNAALRFNLLPGELSLDGSLGKQLGGSKATVVTVGMKWAF